MSPKHRALVETTILASSWYPLELLRALDDHIADKYGERTCIRLGEFTARDALTSLYKSYKKSGDPRAFFTRLLGGLYPTLHDFGAARVEEQSAYEIHLVHDRAGHASARDCLVTLGFFRTVTGDLLDGAVVDEPQCQTRGSVRCVFRVRW